MTLDQLRQRRGRSVLVVEDDAPVAQLIARLLSSERLEGGAWQVTVASTLKAARQALSERLFDLQVVDRDLPGGDDGLDMVDWQRRAGVRTPIVMVTMLAGLEHRMQGRDRRVDQYLGKPFDGDELLAVIRSATWRVNPDGLRAFGKLEITCHGHGAVFFAGEELKAMRGDQGSREQSALRVKEMELLDLMAISDPDPVTVEMAREHIWQVVPGVSIKNSLNATLSRLRKNLVEAGAPDGIVVTLPGEQGWHLNRSLLQCGTTAWP